MVCFDEMAIISSRKRTACASKPGRYQARAALKTGRCPNVFIYKAGITLIASTGVFMEQPLPSNQQFICG